MDINKDSLLGIEGLLIFQINDREYCSDIKYISGVLKIEEANNPGYKSRGGFLDFKDINYKLIDIYKILKTRPCRISPFSKVLLFETFGSHFGFLADRIIEILTIDSIFLENSLDFHPLPEVEFINGELIFQDRKILYLDFEKISKTLTDLKTLKLFSVPEGAVESN